MLYHIARIHVEQHMKSQFDDAGKPDRPRSTRHHRDNTSIARLLGLRRRLSATLYTLANIIDPAAIHRPNPGETA